MPKHERSRGKKHPHHYEGASRLPAPPHRPCQDEDVARKKTAQAIGLCLLTCVLSLPASAADLGRRAGTLWSPYLEWSLPNSTWSGNPFDLVATVTFTQNASGEVRKIAMFYDENNTWKFRFAGTRTGTWTFSTESHDPDLNGHTGTVAIRPNPGVYGFVTNVGNKWARQITENGKAEVFVPQFRMAFRYQPAEWTSDEVDKAIQLHMKEEGFNGIFIFLQSHWVDFESGVSFADTTKRDPDPRTFRAVERVITKVHAAGGVTHIWYLGDCQRNQCIQAGFGRTGAESAGEQRLLRYLAARLSPVPGWTMGYGFDNTEHVDTAGLRGWGNFLRSQMGWRHILGARDQGRNIRYTLWPEADYYSRGDWSNGASYEDVAAVFDSNINLPHAFDERWWKERLNEEGQRRLLWTLTMAGGVGGIWAKVKNGKERPFSNPHWFKTHFTFWKNRFGGDMVRANPLTDEWALKNSLNTRYVFYKNDATSIRMDLSGMAGPQRAVAVDAKKPYEEINLGTLNAVNQTWTAPYLSDWAVAIGP